MLCVTQKNISRILGYVRRRIPALCALRVMTFARDHCALFASLFASCFQLLGCFAKTRFIEVPCRSFGAFHTQWAWVCISTMSLKSPQTKLLSSSSIRFRNSVVSFEQISCSHCFEWIAVENSFNTHLFVSFGYPPHGH